MNWNWDFNDGFTSNSQNPAHTYINPSNYNVILTTNSLHGCSSSVSKPLIIDSKPVVNFSANNGCVNQSISFNDLSVNTVGGIGNWNWDFNDGFTSNSQNPAHIYINSGNYNVTLTANSLHSCSSSASKSFIIDSKPVVDFSVNNGCANQPISFNDLSVNNVGGIGNWT